MARIRIALTTLAILAGATLFASSVASQGTAGEMTGYFWSDTIGWLSLNCSNHGTCGTSNYKFSVNSSGVVTGYAWSDNIGWVSANAADLTGCPSAPCSAQFSSGYLNGWIRAISGGTAGSGGWDGFIRLSNAPTYGITYSGATIGGYAWGDTVVGWLSGSYASTSYLDEPPCAATEGYFCQSGNSWYRDDQCNENLYATCAYLCDTGYGVCVPAPAPDGALTVTPSIIVSGGTVTVSWDIDDAVSCSVTEDNPDITDSWTGTSGSYTSSAISRTTTYTLQCNGLEGTTFSATATVGFRPVWQEI